MPRMEGATMGEFPCGFSPLAFTDKTLPRLRLETVGSIMTLLIGQFTV